MFDKLRSEVTGQAAEVADKIKAEVAKAGQYVTAAICIAVAALAVAVAALVMGVRISRA